MAAKRTRKPLVWVLCLHSLLVYSQTTFQKTFGGPGNETATWVAQADNGFVVSGQVTNTNGNQDALLIRMDASGNTIWQKRFGASQADAFHCVVATPDGGFLAAGETRSFGAGNADIFLVKVDGAGTVLWSKTIGDASHNDIARGIIPVVGGGFVVSGHSVLVSDVAPNSVFLRLDQNGNTMWSRTYTTGIGNLLLSNYIDENVVYASGGADGEAAFVRIDLNSGNLLSTKIYAGSGSEALYYQQPTQDGNLVIADHTWSAATGTDVELWVQKINKTSGQVIWSKVYFRANDNIRGRIEKVNDGGFLLVPYDSNNTTQADALLAKIDANGSLIWSYNYGGAAADRLMKAVQTSDGGFMAVGDTRSNSANGNSDILLLKTDANGLVEGSCPKNANIQTLNFTTNNLILDSGESTWNQTASLTTAPLPLNLLSQGFSPNAAPVIAQTIPLCPNKSINIGGVKHFAPKQVVDTVESFIGCDTIFNYNLTLAPFNSDIRVIGLCADETFTFKGLQYAAGITLLDTVASTTGSCDTVYSIVLKAWAQPTAAQTIAFCPGESVMIGGQLYSQAGTVQASVPSTSGGCDTLITYTLVERPQPTRATNIAFCPGEAVIIGGNSYDHSGMVVVNIPSVTSGCDTIVTYTLEFSPQPTLTETRGLCPGESVTIAGQTYNQPGTVIANLTSVTGGCDTIATYTLELRPQPTRAETRGFCLGEWVTIAGQAYNQPGTVIANLASTTGGCDTIVTYTMELRPQATFAETRGFCSGESVTIAGQTYTLPGTVFANLASLTGGCDTIAIYTLQYLTPAPSNIAIQCPNDVTMVAATGAHAMPATYAEPVAASDCVCPGLQLNREYGLASGSQFPVGITQVCYNVKDNCGQEKPCCFNVDIREENPCDVKLNGCMKYELLSITVDPARNSTYRIRVTNTCANKLISTAIQIPNGLVTITPANNTYYTSPAGRTYIVRSPNHSPMYSVQFKSLSDSIANGQSEVFEYTLPAQAKVSYINITSRLTSQVSYEAHLNTFNCTVGDTPDITNNAKGRDANAVESENSMLLFPNPTTGVLYADLSDWQGQKLQVQVTNAQGQLVHTLNFTAEEDLLRVEMPRSLPAGVYFFELANEKGEKEVMRFVLNR